VSLKEARQRRDKARRLVNAKRDPLLERPAEREALGSPAFEAANKKFAEGKIDAENGSASAMRPSPPSE
jgi:hypothetical protein